MSYDAAVAQPIHQRHMVLILRFTLDAQGRLTQGVAIDLNEQMIGQFRDWQELVALLEHYWPTQRTE